MGSQRKRGKEAERKAKNGTHRLNSSRMKEEVADCTSKQQRGARRVKGFRVEMIRKSNEQNLAIKQERGKSNGRCQMAKSKEDRVKREAEAANTKVLLAQT